MRKLFALLIILPLFATIKIPFTDIEIEISFDFNKILSNLKTKVPEFIEKMKTSLDKFKDSVEAKKDELIAKIKEDIQEKYKKLKETGKKITKEIIEDATKAAKYLNMKVCNMTNMTSYEECRGNKKEVLKRLIEIVHDEFQCSVILEKITGFILSDNIEENLKYILFLIHTITTNPDAIAKGKAQILYDVGACLLDKYEVYMKAILNDTSYGFDLKADISNLLIKTMDNLVKIIHYEEIDEDIKKANETTGIISDNNAKKIHRFLFKAFNKLSELGTKFHNISNNVAVNVLVNEKGLSAQEEFRTEIKDKGIIVTVLAKQLLDKFGAHSIQTAVFDSPFVSLRGTREAERGTSKYFVGITLYDKNGKEILVKDINIEDLKPKLFFKKSLFKAMKTCLFYNEEEEKIENTGVETKTEIINGEEFIKCIPKHLTAFTIGSYESTNINGSNTGTIILIVTLSIVVIALLVVGFYFYKKRAKESGSQQFQSSFNNKDGLLA